MARAKRNASPTAIVLTLTALLALAAVAMTVFKSEPKAVREVKLKDKVVQVIETLPCSWLRVADVEESQSRRRVELKGYSQVATDRLRRLIEMGFADGGARNVELDLRSTSAPPDYACTFIETANRFRYRGLARVSLVNVQESGQVDPKLTFNSSLDFKTVTQNPEYKFVMFIEVFGSDFSKNAQFFTIETDGSVTPLGNLHEMAKLIEVKQLSSKDKLVLAWPATTKENLLFIVDSKKPFDPKQVESLVGKDWTEFNRVAKEKGFFIEMAVVPDGGGPAA